MHLSVARLCLDCQEIHEDDRCPVCTSEVFGFITRWVKVDAPPRRTTVTGARDVDVARIDSYRQILNPSLRRSTTASWLRKGGLLVAAGYLARWGWQVAAQHRRASQENAASPE